MIVIPFLILFQTLRFLCLAFFPLQKKNCEISEELLSRNSVRVISYQSLKKEIGKILILPPTGGVTYLEKKYARDLCEKGFSSFIISSWKGIDEESEELSIHNTLLSRAQSAIAQVIDKKTSPGEFVGIFGTSVGGIHSATALGYFKSIQAGFFILAGAPVHEVIAHSTEKTLEKYRSIRMKKFYFKTKKEYVEALNKKIYSEVQPLNQVDKRKKSFAVIAKNDKTVPTRYQRKLAQAFQSETLEISGGHISSIFLFRLFYRKQLLLFF